MQVAIGARRGLRLVLQPRLSVGMMADERIDHRNLRSPRSAFIIGQRRGSFDAIVRAFRSKLPATG